MSVSSKILSLEWTVSGNLGLSGERKSRGLIGHATIWSRYELNIERRCPSTLSLSWAEHTFMAATLATVDTMDLYLTWEGGRI